MAGRVQSKDDSRTPTPRWLTPEEESAWRAVALMMLQLQGPLDAQMQRDSGITLFEYLVLSSLSMAPGRSISMSELARLTNSSPSRLSNVVKRLEERGWIQRSPDPCDGRTTVAQLTADGWQVVVAAAPGHVAVVRDVVIDPLTTTQLRALAAIGERLGTKLGLRPDPRSAGC